MGEATLWKTPLQCMLLVIASQQVLQVTAALHCSPWESIIPDPRYQIKINLDQKSHFALLFTLEPFSVQMTPPAAGDPALVSRSEGCRCNEKCISQNRSLHMKKYFCQYLLNANTVSVFPSLKSPNCGFLKFKATALPMASTPFFQLLFNFFSS